MKKFLRALKILALFTLGAIVFGWVIMSLWNWLMPYLFNAKVINYWQALGILVLCKILFGGMRRGGGWGARNCYRGYWKYGMEERMKQMSPEEREQFKKQFYEKCKHKWGFDMPEEPLQNE